MAHDQVNYKLLLNEMPGAFILLQVVKDEDGNPLDYIILELNHAFETISGISKKEIIGEKVSALSAKTPNKDFEWLQIYNALPKAVKKPQQFEYHNENKMRWYEISAWSFQTDYLTVLVRDITTGKKEENLLHKNELRFRSLVETMKGGLVVEDENRNIILTNQAFCDIFSIPAPPEALVGHNCTEAAEEVRHLLAEPEAFPRRINEIIKNQEVVIGEEIYFADGRVFERDYIVVFTQDKTFIGHMWQYLDITERKEAGEKLRESEERYRLLIENLNELIYSIDDQARITYVSPNIKELAGYTAEEVIGKHYLEFVHPDDRAGRLEQFQKILAGVNEPSEYRFLTRGGSSIWVRTSARLLYKDGQLAAVQGVLTDITDRIRMEQELQEREALQQVLMKMAIELFNVPLEEVDAAIDRMLKVIGLFSGLDRVYIFRNDYEKQIATNTHEWCAEEITPEIENCQAIPLEIMPELLEANQKGEIYCLPRVGDLPEKDAFRILLHEQGVRSLLALPLFHDAAVIGFVGFDAVREQRDFTTNEITLLRVFAELIANIEKRREVEKLLQHSEKRYRAIVEGQTELICRFTPDGILTFVNDAYCRFFGKSSDELVGTNFLNLIPENDRQIIVDNHAQLSPHKPIISYEHRVLTSEGKIYWQHWIDSAIYDRDGKILELQGVGRDITDRKNTEKALKESELRNRALVNAMPDLLFRYSREGVYLDAVVKEERDLHPHIYKLYRQNKLFGKPVEEVLPSSIAKKIKSGITKALERGKIQILEYSGKGKNATYYYEDRLAPIDQNEVVSIVRDITDKKKHEAELKYISLHDQLTGLYNRHYFENELKRLDSSREYPIAIISADLDGLKLINDTLGHDEGDCYLKAGSELLKSTLRKSDILARVGGDEFALILPHTTREAGEELMGRIRQAIEEYNLNQKGLALSISFGLAVCESNKHKLEDAFRDADHAMYQDKLKRSNDARNAIISSLINKLYKSDARAGAINEQIYALSVQLGKKVGLDDRKIEDIRTLAQFRDLGNLMLPAHLRNKTGKLTEPEKDLVCKHPETGYRIASSSPELVGVADLILKHHENYDGTGYPLGLKGEEVPIECRIVAVCVAYCSMVNPRPHAQSCTRDEAIKELRRCSGKQYDPQLLDLLIAILADNPNQPDN